MIEIKKDRINPMKSVHKNKGKLPKNAIYCTRLSHSESLYFLPGVDNMVIAIGKSIIYWMPIKDFCELADRGS